MSLFNMGRQIINFPGSVIFPFSLLRKQRLTTEYHVHMRHASPKLCYGNTRLISTRFEFHMCFCITVISTTEKFINRVLLTYVMILWYIDYDKSMFDILGAIIQTIPNWGAAVCRYLNKHIHHYVLRINAPTMCLLNSCFHVPFEFILWMLIIQ